MRDVRVEFDGVWKKFQRGSRARSLRDALPAMVRSMQRRFQKPADEITLESNEFYSLRDVSFQVRRGECLGIIGSNGAGKSTLLKCASRILRPNRGKVAVTGRVSALIEVGAGFHPDLTGRENIYLNGAILGMRRREVADRFDRIVEFSGMAQFIDMPVKRYSSGMFARLGFSVAAFMDPDVLLIDEALSVGDIGFAHKCEKKIKEILERETTVVFVSHHLSSVRMICDRVILLGGGKILRDGDPDSTIHAYHEMLAEGMNQGQNHPAIASLRTGLVDQVGSPTLSAETGGAVMLEVELTARRPIREAELGFFLRNEEDHELYATSMERLNAEPIDLAAGDVLRAKFRVEVNLGPGAYWIGPIVMGRLEEAPTFERVTLDRSPNRQQLIVTGPAEAHGSVNLFAACETNHTSSRSAGIVTAAAS